MGWDGMGKDADAEAGGAESPEGGKRKCRPSEIGKTEKKNGA